MACRASLVQGCGLALAWEMLGGSPAPLGGCDVEHSPQVLSAPCPKYFEMGIMPHNEDYPN